MKKRPDFTLVLPCYNEEPVFSDSVRLIIQTLQMCILSFEILFVDDGSTDKTKEMIKAVCKRFPFCIFFFHATNKGRGAAVSTGIRKARGEIVGYMDIDCEVSPLYIPSFVTIVKEHKADVVVGKRIYRTTFTSIIREVLSVGYRMMVRSILDTGGIDTESGYKFFNKKAFLPVLQKIRNQNWFWDTESIVLARRAGLRIREEPVLFLRKAEKKSSVRLIPDTLSYVKNIWEFSLRMGKTSSKIG